MSIKMRFIYDSHHSFLQFYQTNKVSFIGGRPNSQSHFNGFADEFLSIMTRPY